VFLPLPLPDEQGRRVVLLRIGVHNPEQVKVADLFKVNMMIMDVLLEEDDRAVICGTVFITDHSNVTLSHLAQYSPSFAKKTTTLLQVLVHVWSVNLLFPYPFTSSLSSPRHALLDIISLSASSEIYLSVHCFRSNHGCQIATAKNIKIWIKIIIYKTVEIHNIEKFVMKYRDLCLKILKEILNLTI
jgi:hypothetical protein